MADETLRSRRLVRKAEPREAARTIRHTVTLLRRTSGLLAYYAQTRGLTQSMVVEQALASMFRGLRVTDGAADAGEGGAAA